MGRGGVSCAAGAGPRRSADAVPPGRGLLLQASPATGVGWCELTRTRRTGRPTHVRWSRQTKLTSCACFAAHLCVGRASDGPAAPACDPSCHAQNVSASLRIARLVFSLMSLSASWNRLSAAALSSAVGSGRPSPASARTSAIAPKLRVLDTGKASRRASWSARPGSRGIDRVLAADGAAPPPLSDDRPRRARSSTPVQGPSHGGPRPTGKGHEMPTSSQARFVMGGASCCTSTGNRLPLSG